LVKAHFALGLLGGILGLLMTPLNFILSIVALIFGGSHASGFLLLTFVGVPASIAGIAGSVVSRRRFLAGGLTMLLAGVVPLFLALQVLSFLNPVTVLLLIVFLYFWAILLYIAGLTCLLRQQPRPV